jgi:hypothetical protein
LTSRSVLPFFISPDSMPAKSIFEVNEDDLSKQRYHLHE